MKPFIKKIFYLFLPLFLGSIIGLLISSSIDYGTLLKPKFSPPGYLFPIVWSILYLILGISYYFFKENNKDTLEEDIAYFLSLGVNLLWSVFFFVLKWWGFTVLWTLFLLIMVSYLLYRFYLKYKLSFYLNIPYLIWIFYATYLTLGVYFLNQGM